MMDVTWRHEHDNVRRIPGEELWIVRDFRDGGATVQVFNRDGESFGTLGVKGDMWVGYPPDSPFTVEGTSQAGAAKALRDHVYGTRAVKAMHEDPSVALHRWDANRPRSAKTADARADGKFGVGPSDLNGCEKAVEFRERPPEGHEPIDIPKDAALMGSLIDDALTEARRSLYPWRQFKRKVPIVGLDAPGELDEYDPIIGRVTDYKTASNYKWDMIGDDGPPEGEWQQVMTYARGLIDEGETVLSVQLLYVKRETGEHEVFTRPYDGNVADLALAKLHVMMDALEAGDPLPRRRAGDELLGPTQNTLCARYCPHVKTCWNLDEVPEHRTPEGYLLVREDDDGAIAATLHVYDDSREVEKTAVKQKEYARDLVKGLEPGTYGDMTLNWTGGKKSEKKDPEARAAQLEQVMRFAIETDTPPPDPDELDYPTTEKTSRTSIQVKRVRAAQREES